ncbi:MAG: UDP-glucose 4-epimerase GalE [Leptospiraceae bacterium]|nr:UDP-glucose 4-epimerase GalE [Leptospiraceae bacterium]MCP5497932.1 UDP-glucose 4-epimerase GalE [Leptospiraceae bacterium]
MRLLVTGGAGYIGSHIVLELLKLNHEVVVVDSLAAGNEKNLFKEASFIKGEIQDNKVLKEVFQQKFDAVFHFAAWKAAGESMLYPEKYSINNINGTMKLLVAMSEHDCKNIIFSSSAAVYGTPKYLPLDENHPLEPENYYGFTKLMIEENLKWYEKLKGIHYACLRYFNAAGYDPEGKIQGIEKTTANLMPIVMETASGIRKEFQIFGTDYPTSDGTCIRDYIHVSDLANAHILSMDYLIGNKKSLIVNLGSEKGYSVREMVDISERIVGKRIPYSITGRRQGDPPELLASSDKAHHILNWRPKYSDPELIIQSMWNLYSKIS